MKTSAQTSIPFLTPVSFLDIVLFTKHLSIMLKSGITLIESLGILEKQTKSNKFKEVIKDITDDIKNGQSLKKSLGKHPQMFSPFYISLIEVGEQSGKLDQNLEYLAQQLSKEYAFRQKVRGALAYPTIVFIAALGVGLGVSFFLLPNLLSVFEGVPVNLPWSTQLLLDFATLMKNYGIFVVSGIAILLLLLRLLATAEKTKPFLDAVLLHVPLFGAFIQNAELAIICRNLGVMIKSGLPITQALEIESTVSTNAVYRNYMKHLLAAVTRGKSLASELEKNTYTQIPLLAKKMIAVGEQTGKLDETLLYLADFFEDEVDDTTKNLTTIFEPIMLLIIGGIVAFIALAIISPIYSLTGSIK